MKNFFLILVMCLAVTNLNAVQPVRKPFLNLTVNGKPAKNGETVTVTPGQKLSIAVEMEGGRRDFCKFPDTYADIVGSAQILSRGDEGLTYTANGIKAEWLVKSKNFRFESEGIVNITAQQGSNSAEVAIGNNAFSQTYVKISGKTTWQFIQESKTTSEENVAEATVYLKLAGASDQWFSSKNIRATGIKNEQVQEKMNVVQATCDSITANFHRLNFAGVQQMIRTLQTNVNELKSTIDKAKSANAAYQAKITFVGLPSDDPFRDIESLNTLKSTWSGLETLTGELKNNASKLPEQGDNESKKKLVDLLKQYEDWFAKLPESSLMNLADYLPGIKMNDVRLPQNLSAVVSSKTVNDYAQSLGSFKTFLEKRGTDIANETQLISSVQSRIQAIRVLDGMLRSYFSSINWAEWQNTREL